MKNFSILSYSLIILFIFSAGCKKDDIIYASGHKVPSCIEQIIREIAADEKWNPPAKVFSYTYREQLVYYVPPRCCDIPSLLYNKDCQVICSPDGGFSGKGDGQCSDFFTERTNEKLIWEDKR